MKKYEDMVYSVEESDPLTYREAIRRSDAKKWKEAMDSEIASLNENDTWELVEKPADRKVVKAKWVYKKKLNLNGEVEKYKARLVAKGFTQRKGIDYNETFSPTVRYESVRILFALAAQYGLEVHQMDAITAFLNGF